MAESQLRAFSGSPRTDTFTVGRIVAVLGPATMLSLLLLAIVTDSAAAVSVRAAARWMLSEGPWLFATAAAVQFGLFISFPVEHAEQARGRRATILVLATMLPAIWVGVLVTVTSTGSLAGPVPAALVFTGTAAFFTTYLGTEMPSSKATAEA